MNNVLDPRDEVRKLQDLVRQLELQNAQLRSKQQARRREQASPPLKTSTAASAAAARGGGGAGLRRGSASSLTDRNDNVRNMTLEDVDCIDVNAALDLSDEGSWLFSSPKKLTEEEKSISPYKWMRRDVEDPDNKELQAVKRALVNKLDEIARVRFSGLEQLRSPVQNEPEREKSPLFKPAATGVQRKIDTRTFTRPRKHREEFGARIPAIFDENVEPAPRVPTDADTPEDDCISTASDSSMSTSTLHHLADVVDVQALARLQEESLQENLPVSSPRRNSASGFPQASTVPVNNLENLYRQINENDPGKQNFSCSKSDSLDDSLSSDVSENLQTYESFDEDSTYSSNHRGSLPNISRHHQNGLPVRSTGNLNTAVVPRTVDSRLPNPQLAMCRPPTPRNSDGNRNKDVIHDSGVSRESRIPLQNVRRDSQSGIPSTISSRSNSPTSRCGIPQLRRSGSPADVSPRSNLPKPMQSRIPAPRTRSNLPIRSSVSQSYSVDESWKEGCF